LIAFGLAVEALACFHLRDFDTDVSFWHVAVARMFQGAGLPFLFVPITTVSYAGLPPGKSNNASALINTMRNLGGSFGISVAVALLARRGQYHHARLAEHVSAFSTAPRPGGGLTAIAGILNRQAQMLSYLDIFTVLTILAGAAILSTFLLRSINPKEAHAGH
jgi:DHA2 family multidrug resistance protein